MVGSADLADDAFDEVVHGLDLGIGGLLALGHDPVEAMTMIRTVLFGQSAAPWAAAPELSAARANAKLPTSKRHATMLASLSPAWVIFSCFLAGPRYQRQLTLAPRRD